MDPVLARTAQVLERVEDALRPPDTPKRTPQDLLPDPDQVLDDVMEFVSLARDGAYMYGDRRVSPTARSKFVVSRAAAALWQTMLDQHGLVVGTERCRLHPQKPGGDSRRLVRQASPASGGHR